MKSGAQVAPQRGPATRDLSGTLFTPTVWQVQSRLSTLIGLALLLFGLASRVVVDHTQQSPARHVVV